MGKPTPLEAVIIRKWNCYHWSYLTARHGKDGSSIFVNDNKGVDHPRKQKLRPQINQWDKKFLTRARRRQDKLAILEELEN